MAEFRLETDRLILRDWRGEDWQAFFRHTNTPAVMRWLGGQLNDEQQAAMRERLELWSARYGHTFWAVERREDGGHLAGELLGFCGLKRADAPDSTVPGEFEVGWRLREDAWGKGYAKEAAIASLDAGFGQFGAERILAMTVDGNTDSWGLMQRLGMERRAELDYPDLRYPAELQPTIVYSMSRDDWTTR